MEILIIIGKTILFYFMLIIVIRIMGKREVGNLSVFDLAVYFTISDLITMSIVDDKNEIWLPMIAVGVLVVMQILLSYISLKHKKFRDFIDGKISLIINNGEIDFNEMKKQRYSVDDFFTQLRDKGYDSPKNIKWAILENSGKLSVISNDISESSYPDPIICDGKLITENLNAIKKDEQWLYNKISSKKIKNIRNIKIALYVNDDLLFYTFK